MDAAVREGVRGDVDDAHDGWARKAFLDRHDRMISVVVVLVHHRVTLAASDQPAICGPGWTEGDRETQDDAPPELRVAEARVQRARHDCDEAVVDRLHDRD